MPKIDNFHKIIIANWKLNGSLAFVEKYLNNIRFDNIKNHQKCVVICPPFVFLNNFNSSNLLLGAQDCSSYSDGSYTGEISAKILKDIGCNFCIIGHSERRNFFNEKNESIYKKIINCIENKIIPILCVGESLVQKKENQTKEILITQIQENIPKISNNKNTIIAYEPLWAIGSGLMPTLEEISEIHTFIKYSIPQSNDYKILYGGSVNSSNCKEIINNEKVDGVLVGGASINIDEFNKIIES